MAAIRRFVADGLHWVALGGLLIGYAVYSLPWSAVSLFVAGLLVGALAANYLLVIGVGR